jgi:hypothetical protein
MPANDPRVGEEWSPRQLWTVRVVGTERHGSEVRVHLVRPSGEDFYLSLAEFLAAYECPPQGRTLAQVFEEVAAPLLRTNFNGLEMRLAAEAPSAVDVIEESRQRIRRERDQRRRAETEEVTPEFIEQAFSETEERRRAREARYEAERAAMVPVLDNPSPAATRRAEETLNLMLNAVAELMPGGVPLHVGIPAVRVVPDFNRNPVELPVLDRAMPSGTPRRNYYEALTDPHPRKTKTKPKTKLTKVEAPKPKPKSQWDRIGEDDEE